MKDAESKLNRLFRAARSAPEPGVEAAMPAHLKTRILAHWRSQGPLESGWLSVASLFRRALACATMAMLVCLVWSYTGYTDPNFTDPGPDQLDDASSSYEMPPDPMP